MRWLLAPRRSSLPSIKEVECMMKKVLPLLALALVLGANGPGALAQTKDGGATKAEKSVAADHAGVSSKEQRAAAKDSQGANRTKDSAQSKKDEEKGSLSSSTASVAPVTVGGGGATATTDAPAKTGPNIPVGSALTKEPASGKA